MQSDEFEPVNIGPAHEVSIRDLIKAISKIAGKQVISRFGAGPTGVSKICSDNRFIRTQLQWEPQITVDEGLQMVYPWIEKQVLDKQQAA